MAVSGVGAPVSSAATSGSAKGYDSLSSEQFLKIMMEELKNQDPLKPNDSSKLMEQISTVRNIQSQMSLQDTLKSLVGQNQIASAGNLIGKYVEGLDANNSTTKGVVTGVRVQNGKAVLELDSGVQLDMERVTIITNKAAA